MSSTFDEFQVMINQLDIVFLSEAWLSDNKHVNKLATLKYQAIILFAKIENRKVVVEQEHI